MRTRRAPRPSDPTLCAVTRAPSSSRCSSSASSSGSLQPGRRAQPDEPRSQRGLGLFDHPPRRVIFFRQLDRRIGQRAAALVGIGHVLGHLLEARREAAPRHRRDRSARTCPSRRRRTWPTAAGIPPPTRPSTRSGDRASSCWCRRPRRWPRPRPPGFRAGRIDRPRPRASVRAEEFSRLFRAVMTDLAFMIGFLLDRGVTGQYLLGSVTGQYHKTVR